MGYDAACLFDVRRLTCDHQFLEAQGCGVQIIMSAKTALEMGAAIRGIVAFTSTSSSVIFIYVFDSMVLISSIPVTRLVDRSLPPAKAS
jgi:hypothetical protein